MPLRRMLYSQSLIAYQILTKKFLKGQVFNKLIIHYIQIFLKNY